MSYLRLRLRGLRHLRPGQCLCWLSAMRRRVGEPLALCADQKRVSAFGVVQAGLNPFAVDFPLSFAVGVTEIEFGGIAMQMRRANVMERADDSALQDREESFDSIAVNIAA